MEEQHKATDRTTVGVWRCDPKHQTETREAGDVNDHMTVCHLTRCDEVHAVPSDVSYRKGVLSTICKGEEKTLFIQRLSTR